MKKSDIEPEKAFISIFNFQFFYVEPGNVQALISKCKKCLILKMKKGYIFKCKRIIHFKNTL